jgi:hypothetical protein
MGDRAIGHRLIGDRMIGDRQSPIGRSSDRAIG